MAAVLDARGVEADMFWLFAAIMDDLEPLFASDVRDAVVQPRWVAM